jgi:DNA-binding NtrC family response regulator
MRSSTVRSPAMGATKSSGRPRILCVDDEPLVLKSLAAALRKHVDVVSANGAAEALDLLERDSAFPIVISDYRMPGMNGGAFLAQVRRRFPSIVRMLLSGAGAEDVVLDNPDLVFRFLSKPCPRETLLQALDDAFARGAAGLA